MSALGDPARVPKMMPPPTSETATGGWERRRIDLMQKVTERM